MKKIILFILANLFTLICFSQDSGNDVVLLYKKAVEAYNTKNYTVYLENYKKICGIRKDYPAISYNLAGAYALNNKFSESLENLNDLASKGLFYSPEDDSDFISLKNMEEFKRIIRIFKSNLEPKGKSQKAFEFYEKDLLTEGIAYDEITGNFYISSVYKRKIISMDKQGKAKYIPSENDGLWGVFGMKIDSKKRLLWVSTSAIPQVMNIDEKEIGKTGIYKYDLNTGKVIKKYILSDTLEGHMLGDLALNNKGDVFITDSRSPNIYQISAEKDELELYLKSEEFTSLQGIDFSGDGKFFFISDYIKGLFKINIDNKTIYNFQPPIKSTLYGIDGICFYNGYIIGIQNGLNPNRVIRIKLDKEFDKAIEVKVLEANNPDFNEPTLGVMVKNEFYYIAKSQWGAFNEKGKVIDMNKLEKPLIMKVKVND